ncbi:MAG: enoyl-ACP reductase [Bacillota bacterium]|nr:enoyl-ACP reductase [Bacillota bacterium]
MQGLLSNKNILIMGLRNKWSISWGIAKAVHAEGGKVIFTYQGEREKANAQDLAKDLGNSAIYSCDIGSDEEINSLFSSIKSDFGRLDGMVHAIAHANREDLVNGFIETSRSGFSHAMDISVYSLVAACKKAQELMTNGGGIVTLSYLGSERVLQGYNVMGVAKAALEASVRYLAPDLGKNGIRINAISSGPIKTISAKAIKDFSNILDAVEEKAPLKRGVTQDDIGGSALYLLSNLSSGMTGEVIYVDCGYNIMGI